MSSPETVTAYMADGTEVQVTLTKPATKVRISSLEHGQLFRYHSGGIAWRALRVNGWPIYQALPSSEVLIEDNDRREVAWANGDHLVEVIS